MSKNIGKVKQIIGAVVDVEFKEELPKIYEALEIKMPDNSILTLETQQHIGFSMVRTVAMGSTDGLARNIDAIATGAPISVPVGEKTLGRMFDALGNPLDDKEAVETEKRYPIHREAPKFTEQSTKTE